MNEASERNPEKTNDMTCEQARRLMADYWNESLGEASSSALDQHLGTCQACREEVARLGGFWSRLGSAASVAEPGEGLRNRFYDMLSAYRQGMDAGAPGASQANPGRAAKLSRWFAQPAWQAAAAVVLLAVGLGAGLSVPRQQQEGDLVKLRQEVADMRQLIALSLLQQQSASERLRGVSWAYRAEPSDLEVQQALIAAINHDANVNVRLAAVDALRTFSQSPETRRAVVDALPRQNTPIVQVALIDLVVDLEEGEAAPELRTLASNETVDQGVRERAQWALERLP